MLAFGLANALATFQAAASFAALRQALVSAAAWFPLLPTSPFVVHIDASGFALGAVLQHDQGTGL
jgi:hypothetical protein